MDMAEFHAMLSTIMVELLGSTQDLGTSSEMLSALLLVFAKLPISHATNIIKENSVNLNIPADIVAKYLNIPADIVAKFQTKYDWLKRERVPTLESAVEPGIYQTPDGGWQCNYDGACGYGCAITLRPGETEPHEVHGEICKRWYQEGGAFDENCKRGWLGYPISDEEVYEGSGDPNDRISHFENGDIIWSENTKETRTVKKNNTEMTALNPKRREIIKPLEGLRSLVKRPDNGLTESRATDMERSIDSLKRSICFDRYRVTVFGAFSAGKSTLLNALMGGDYLPSADLPTTNVTTEIFRSDRFYVFMPSRDMTENQIEELHSEIKKDISGGTFLKDLKRDGLTIPGAGVFFQPDDSKGFCQVIEQLASEQNRHETGLSHFKKWIKDGHCSVLQLGIPNLPEWLGEITLTDAPGAGSVYKGHESIIDDIIPKTQLVLYVVESPKAGSSVDEWLCNRIVNSYRRKVFFILNKIDQQNNDEINDALAELKEHIPSVKAGGDGEPTPPKPEFLKTSALCETIANRLSDGSATIKDLIDNRKLSISTLLISAEWTSAKDDEEKKQAAIQFLRDQSHFDELREKIKSYLHEENKELPFCEKATDLIKIYGQELETVCKTTITAFREDRSVQELENKQRELHRLREQNAKEVRSVLKDFQESALRPGMGVLSKVESKLSEIPDSVTKKLESMLADNDEFKRLTANKGEGLNIWLAREVTDQMEPFFRSLNGELRRQGESLVGRLRPILAKIDDSTLAHQCNSISKEIMTISAQYSGIGDNVDENILGATVSAGVCGGAVITILGLTVGSTTIAGTGLAGLAGSAGLGSLASTLAGLGWGTQASTMAFWGLGLGPVIAIVGLVGVATAIIGTTLAKNIYCKKIVEKVKLELPRLIVGNENTSIVKKLNAKVEMFVNESVDRCRNNLGVYLDNLDKQEKKIIADVAKAKDDKEGKIQMLETFRQEVNVFVESSVQSLRELNPGKEPVHG